MAECPASKGDAVVTSDAPSLELPDPATNDEGSNGRSRRLFRRLCLLLLAMLVVPVLIVGYRYQQQMNFLKKYDYNFFTGPNVKTSHRGPDWLRGLLGEERMLGIDNIISIDDLPEASVADLDLLVRHPLRELHLFDTELSQAVIEILGKFQKLEKLELARCSPISEELMTELAMLKNLKELEITYRLSIVINFKSVHLDKTIQQLLDEILGSPFDPPPDTRLALDPSMTTHSLSRLRNLSSLKSLSFRGLELTDDYLPEIGQLTQLEVLDLSDTSITDEGLLHLAKLPNLSELRLRQTSITDEGVKFFVGHSTLRTLDLTDTNISNEGFEWLQKHLPHCEVIRFPSTISIVIRR